MSERDEAVYVRRPMGWMPDTSAGQAVVIAAELVADGWDVQRPAGGEDGLEHQVLDEQERYDRERTQRVLRSYRPELEAEFGGELAGKILGHRFIDVFATHPVDEEMEPDEAVRAAALWLREHPSASVADAFNAVNGIEV